MGSQGSVPTGEGYYMQQNKLWAGVAALAVGSGLLASPVFAAAAPKAGGACAKKQVNKTVGTLICKKEGSKYVYRAVQVTASTAAPVAASGASNEGAAADDLKGTKITFFHWRAEDKDVLAGIINDFTAKTGIEVDQSIKNSNDYQSQALQDILDGKPADVFTAFRGAQFFNMAKANGGSVFLDITNQPFVKNYNKNLIAPGQYEGKQLGLPYQLVFNMPLVNMDLLKQLNLTLPNNINDLQRFCNSVKSKGITPIAWPGGTRGNAGQLSMNGLVMNNMPSDDAFSKIDTGAAKVTDYWMVKTIQEFKDVAQDCFQDNPLATRDDGALADFATGKALMLATGTFSMGPALRLNPNLKFGMYVPITTPLGQTPKWEGIYNATYIVGVNARQKDAKKQAAAIKFVDWLSQPENAEKYANGTSQHSTVTGVKYVKQELKDTGIWADKKVFLAPRFQFLNLDIRNALEDAMLAVAGGKDAKAAAAEAQGIIDKKLGLS
jgi:raffinose/stachyose/melibiose transport system substrate-binding protein